MIDKVKALAVQNRVAKTEDSLKAYRDVKNSIDTALEKGREEGKKWKANQIAKKMLDAGMDIETVMQITDLSKSEIEKLKK